MCRNGCEYCRAKISWSSNSNCEHGCQWFPSVRYTPFGLMLGNTFGWRAPFIFISVLTLLSITGIFFFMGRVAPTSQISLGKQLTSLKDRKVLFAQLTSVILLTGHSI